MSLTTTVPALLLNVAAIVTLAYVIYFRRHHRRDLVGAYVALDLGVFCAVTLLATQSASAGLGFALFGILSIVRLRSSSIAQEEVGYFFVALTLGLVGGLGAGSLGVCVVLYAVLLGGMYLADHPRLASRDVACTTKCDVRFRMSEVPQPAAVVRRSPETRAYKLDVLKPTRTQPLLHPSPIGTPRSI